MNNSKLTLQCPAGQIFCESVLDGVLYFSKKGLTAVRLADSEKFGISFHSMV